jgi:[ribosomal protein S5]-alanine N-acetyltransferase
MFPPRMIETERLQLGAIQLEDAFQIHESYAQDKEVTRYLTWKPNETLKVTQTVVRNMVENWENSSQYCWVIKIKSTDTLIGALDLRPEGSRSSLGYVLARPFLGNGYMAETVSIVARLALESDDTFRIWAVCDVDNIRSARVLEKAGMQREGILRRWAVHPNMGTEPRDCICYSIVK